MKWKYVRVGVRGGNEQIVVISMRSEGLEVVVEREEVDENEEEDCWIRNIAPLTFTVYTSDSSADHEREHKKNVDECMLCVLLQTPELDKNAHFLILSGYNYKAKRFESNVVVFSDFQSKLYQQNLLYALQNACDTELIHCSSDVIHSPHWWVQKQLLDYNIDVKTVYSNCHYCLLKVEKLVK